jgi:hypothetical protein
MFSHRTPVLGYGGMERLAFCPLLCWTVIAGIRLLRRDPDGSPPPGAVSRAELRL